MRLSQKWKIRSIIAVLILTFFITERNVEKYGDNYQIALPVMALACSVTNGQAADFLWRYVAGFTILHGSKILLGETEINRRPNGGYRGFPSGHTTAAAFGASYLVHECIEKNLWIKGVVIITAGYVGGSRIDAGAHDVWQVLFGALLGWLTDRAFRHSTTPLGWIKRVFRAMLGSRKQSLD